MLKHSAVLALSVGLLAPDNATSTAGGSDLIRLLMKAAEWAFTAITTVETEGGPEKLKRAAESFGDELAKQVNSLEARAGVLGGFLNGPGIDAIEHMAIMRALEAGGSALQTLYQNVIQRVFTVQRLAGNI